MKITDEYNNNQVLMKNVANVDYTTLVVNNIWTKICVIGHKGYRAAVVSHGTIHFTMSLSFRYSEFVPLVYNITRRTGDNVFEEMVGSAVIGTAAEPSRLFNMMYAMRTKYSGNETKMAAIMNANKPTGDDNIVKTILMKLDNLYMGESNEWIEIQHITK